MPESDAETAPTDAASPDTRDVGGPASATTDDARAAEAQESTSEVTTWIADHLGFITAIAVTAFTLAKIGHESRWQSNTITAAFSAGSTFEVLVPIALISGAVAITTAAAVGVLVLFPRRYRLVIWGLLTFLAAVVAPLPLNVVLAVFFAALLRRDFRTGTERTTSAVQLKRELDGPRVRSWIGGLAGLLIGYTVLLGGMWLPAEAIGIQDEGTAVGYVVEIDGPWTTVILEHDRTLRRYATDDVNSRVPCADDRFGLGIALINHRLPNTGGQGTEPECDKLRTARVPMPR